MRRALSRSIRGLLALSLGVAVAGCAIGQSSRVNASHFVYPNSNVVPMHKTHGKKTSMCGILFVGWNGFTANKVEQAYARALKGGGDLVINAVETRTQFLVPMLFQLCSITVVGTAAKMEVGKQELR